MSRINAKTRFGFLLAGFTIAIVIAAQTVDGELLAYAISFAGSLLAARFAWQRFDNRSCLPTAIGGCIGATVAMVGVICIWAMIDLTADYIDPNPQDLESYYSISFLLPGLVILLVLPSFVLGFFNGIFVWLFLRNYYFGATRS